MKRIGYNDSISVRVLLIKRRERELLMKRGKKNKTAKVISLIMTAMMLITSNSIVMASQITWQEEKNESIPGELNVESQNSSPVPELLGRVEENLESVGDITQGDIIKEETVQEVNEAEGNKAEADRKSVV